MFRQKSTVAFGVTFRPRTWFFLHVNLFVRLAIISFTGQALPNLTAFWWSQQFHLQKRSMHAGRDWHSFYFGVFSIGAAHHHAVRLYAFQITWFHWRKTILSVKNVNNRQLTVGEDNDHAIFHVFDVHKLYQTRHNGARTTLFTTINFFTVTPVSNRRDQKLLLHVEWICIGMFFNIDDFSHNKGTTRNVHRSSFSRSCTQKKIEIWRTNQWLLRLACLTFFSFLPSALLVSLSSDFFLSSGFFLSAFFSPPSAPAFFGFFSYWKTLKFSIFFSIVFTGGGLSWINDNFSLSCKTSKCCMLLNHLEQRKKNSKIENYTMHTL